ncbi:MAG: bacterioferritin [Gammaproteobacteria bacterium]|nr:bacterioferritin [Gammaproteobacteria bacterium]MCP4881307.1 bacterioferritin [Gammaproteobacteria bacterium]
MKGNNKVLAHLQSLLNYELTARDQYMAHSRIYRDMGLHKLYERLNHEMEEEIEHADLLIERMLFLEATPDYNQQGTVNVGATVPEMLQLDLDVEYAVDGALKAAVAVCEQEQDYDSRRILSKLLEDTEMDHAYWLERQLRLIDLVGLPNYVQSQMS